MTSEISLVKLPFDENWQQKIDDAGLPYHSFDGGYWQDDLCLRLSPSLHSRILGASQSLHDTIVEACKRVILGKEMREHIPFPPAAWEVMEKSLSSDMPSVFGRFDLTLDERGEVKMYEYNSDTPTSLPEGGPAQNEWFKRRMTMGHLPDSAFQFNNILPSIQEAFSHLRGCIYEDTLDFTCLEPCFEDYCNINILLDLARSAGLNARFIPLADLVFDPEVCIHGSEIVGASRTLFKLYPWEMMFDEALQEVCSTGTTFIEPPWKALASCKALLPVLWAMYPNNPHLIPAYFDPKPLEGNYAKKPIFSREGANVSIFRNGVMTDTVEGPYGKEGFIYQSLTPTVKPFGSDYGTVIGSWMVSGKPVGIGCRIDQHPVSSNGSLFCPHAFY